MGGQRSTFRGPMVLDFGGQWSGANGLGPVGGQSSIYPLDRGSVPYIPVRGREGVAALAIYPSDIQKP